MLKSFLEMRAIDVSTYCQKRKGKDENKKEIDIYYLPWDQCLILLYLNGAEKVEYRPLPAPNGSLYFSSEETTNKDGRISGCYFVKVEVKIDNNTYCLDYPVMNGTNVVYKDALNQLRVHNSIQRALVKCVAINTGLGISLWEKGDETSETASWLDDPFNHDPLKVKEAIGQAMSAKMRALNISTDELYERLEIKEKTHQMIIRGLEGAHWLLGKLKSV